MIAQLQSDVVQGPLEHTRLGRAVVIHPSIATPRANRFPSQAVVVTSAARRLIQLSKDGEKLAAVVVEGDDERDPTAHPEFHEISQNLRELMNKWFPKAKLCLISDAPDLSRPQTRHALGFYDQPMVRLEPGTQRTASRFLRDRTMKEVVENMGRVEIERLVVVSRFVRGDVDNTKPNEVKAWIRNLGEIRPAQIQIHTPAKAKDKQKPATKTQLTQIAELATEKTGIPVEVWNE